MAEPKGEPIWIRCEGSGGNANLSNGAVGNCQMCNRRMILDGVGVEGKIPEHERDDILARLNRGDFG
jgi:hypothetical protein